MSKNEFRALRLRLNAAKRRRSIIGRQTGKKEECHEHQERTSKSVG